MASKDKDKCLRCGKCCKVYDLQQKIFVDCKYLIRYKDGRTRCSVYPHRIGAINGISQECHKREDVHLNYPNCPYNNPDWPMHKHYKY